MSETVKKLVEIESITKKVVAAVDERVKRKKENTFSAKVSADSDAQDVGETEFCQHVAGLLQVYELVQDNFKTHMKSFANASITDLPEPDLQILGTSKEKLNFEISDLKIHKVHDSSLVKEEASGRDYSRRLVQPACMHWPAFVSNPVIKSSYTKMLRTYLPRDIFAFQDESANVTDILRITRLSAGTADESQIEILASFSCLFHHVTAHQDRLICDAFVYEFPSFSELCTLEVKYKTLCISPMFHQMLLVGHDRYRQLSLLKWEPAVSPELPGKYVVL